MPTPKVPLTASSHSPQAHARSMAGGALVPAGGVAGAPGGPGAPGVGANIPAGVGGPSKSSIEVTSTSRKFDELGTLFSFV